MMSVPSTEPSAKVPEPADAGVSASRAVIDPEELTSRLRHGIAVLRQASRSHHATPGNGVDIVGRASALRAHVAGTSLPGSPDHAGWRGAAARRAKTVVRRLIYWYVDPIHQVHQQHASLMSEQLVAQAEVIADLRRQVEELRESLADLRYVTGQAQKAARGRDGAR